MASSGSRASTGQLAIDDLRHIHGFLDSQKRALSNQSFTRMLENQLAVWTTRVEQTFFSPEEATEMVDLLAEGPWTVAQREALSMALGEKMESTAAGAGKKPRRDMQTLKCFGAYLTDKDVEVLSDPEIHNVNKMSMLVDKCVAMGLHLPKENTSKQIVKTAIDCAPVQQTCIKPHVSQCFMKACKAQNVFLTFLGGIGRCMFTANLVLLSGGAKANTPQETYKLVQEFKTQLKARIKHKEKLPLPLTTFPDDPSKLPKSVYQAVFGTEKPSPPSKTHAAGENAYTVVARKSHNSVKKNIGFDDMKSMMTQMQQMNNMMGGNSMMDGFNPMMVMMAGFNALQMGHHGQGNGGNLQIFHSRKRNAGQKALMDLGAADKNNADQKALTDGRAADAEEPESENIFAVPEPEVSTPTESKPPGQYAAEFEQTLKAREKQKEKEKQASKASDPDTLKRPAAATPPKAKKAKGSPASEAHEAPAAAKPEEPTTSNPSASTKAKAKPKANAKAKAEATGSGCKDEIAAPAPTKSSAKAKTAPNKKNASPKTLAIAKPKAKAKAVNIPPGKKVGCAKCRYSTDWGCAQCRKRAGMTFDPVTMEWNWPDV